MQSHLSVALSVLTFFSLGVCGCNGRGGELNELPAGPSSNDAGLVLRLHPEKSSYKQGSPIFVSIELKNYGDVERTVCANFAPAEYVTRFEIRDGSGKLSPGPNLVFQSSPNDAECIPLVPLVYVGAQIDLATWYSIRHSGTYRVKAFYDINNRVAPPPSRTWKGKLESNEIYLRVE